MEVEYVMIKTVDSFCICSKDIMSIWIWVEVGLLDGVTERTAGVLLWNDSVVVYFCETYWFPFFLFENWVIDSKVLSCLVCLMIVYQHQIRRNIRIWKKGGYNMVMKDVW